MLDHDLRQIYSTVLQYEVVLMRYDQLNLTEVRLHQAFGTSTDPRDRLCDEGSKEPRRDSAGDFG